MSRYATIDVGTNTALLLIAEEDGAGLRTVLDQATFTRLGQGIDATGRLAPEAAQATLAVLEDYAALARAAGVDGIAAIGTACLREAADGKAFAGEAGKRLGFPLDVISGEEEARLVALAAARAFPAHSSPRIVFDIGGGSTELILQGNGELLERCTYPVGSVKFTERYLASDPPAPNEVRALVEAAREAFVSLPFSPPRWTSPQDAVGTAGTITTLCAVAGKVAPYDPVKIHGAVLSAAAVQTIFENLTRLTLAERKQVVGLTPKRADIIVAGAAILLAVLERLQAPSLTVCNHGIRHGLFWDRFAAPRRPAI
jgi:exopolyphosphatase/guanosine-5'-triphosphate,3'-diphosphate pyrophosphatase